MTYYILLVVPGFSEETEPDSALLVQQINTLQAQNKFASAHLLVEDYIQQAGMKPYFVCWMVNNGLKNFYRHENYELFFLKDEEKFTQKPVTDTQKKMHSARLRNPQRILEKVIQQNPREAYAHLLLGYYYDLQLKDLNNLDFARQYKITSLEDKIFGYYSQAEKLGYQDSYLNRWLGDYHSGKNQITVAEKYYLRNTKKLSPDPISLYRLSEISFQNKKYTQAYNFASDAVKYFSAEDIYLKYDAIRLAARSLKELGEDDRFIELSHECIAILPDLQDAYLDLIDFYTAQKDTAKIENLFTEMLLKNPYELKGYRVLESNLNLTKNYEFADSLFDRMLVKYENWDEVLANIYWSRGNLAFYQKQNADAADYWEISRNYMRRYLPPNHTLIRKVGEIAKNR